MNTMTTDRIPQNGTCCRARDGAQLLPRQHVTILVPARFHAGAGQVTRLLPGVAGDAPCVEVRDAEGRRVITAAADCQVNG